MLLSSRDVPLHCLGAADNTAHEREAQNERQNQPDHLPAVFWVLGAPIDSLDGGPRELALLGSLDSLRCPEGFGALGLVAFGLCVVDPELMLFFVEIGFIDDNEPLLMVRVRRFDPDSWHAHLAIPLGEIETPAFTPAPIHQPSRATICAGFGAATPHAKP